MSNRKTQGNITNAHDRFMIEITDDPSTDVGLPGRRFAICDPDLSPTDNSYVLTRLSPGVTPTIRLMKRETGGTDILVPINKKFPVTKLEDAEILASVLSLSIKRR